MWKKLTTALLALSVIGLQAQSAKAATPNIHCVGPSYSEDRATDWGNLKTGNFIGNSSSNTEYVEYCGSNVFFTEVDSSGQIVNKVTTSPTNIPDNANDYLAATGDLNNDSQTDLLFAFYPYASGAPTTKLQVGLMSGTTVTSDVTINVNYNTSLWRPFGMCDIDGDNKTDILWQGLPGTSAANQLAYWKMDGTTFISGVVLSQTAASGWSAVDCKDYNGDSKPDFLWVSDFVYSNQNSGTKSVGYWIMNNTSFSSAAQITTLSYDRRYDEYIFPGFMKYNGSSSFNSIGVGDAKSSSLLGLWLTNGGSTITSSFWFSNPNNL